MLLWTSHVTRVDESCRMRECVTHVSYDWVKSLLYTYEWVTNSLMYIDVGRESLMTQHEFMTHVVSQNHWWVSSWLMSHIWITNEWVQTCVQTCVTHVASQNHWWVSSWLMSHIWTESLMSEFVTHVSYLNHWWVSDSSCVAVSLMSLSHIHMNESRTLSRTYEWVTNSVMYINVRDESLRSERLMLCRRITDQWVRDSCLT